MKIVFDPDFLRKLKNSDVKIRKSFKERVLLFSRNPNNPQLNNHSLRGKYQGYRSIDINNDWRIIYKEIINEEEVAYFFAIGTHKQLYG